MKIKFYLLTVLLPLLFSCSNDDNILNSSSESDSEYYEFYVAEALDAMNMPRPEGSYNYPCLPGMPSWEKLQSDKEMEQACRVPEKVLKEQSTQAVVQALWEHPQFKSLIGYSSNTSIQQSLDKVLPVWDIYKELVKRTDAASCLAERYHKLKLTKESHAFYNNSLQLLLSQTVFLNQLSADKKTLLTKEMFKRIDTVNHVLDADADKEPALVNSSYFCLVRMMANSQYAPMKDWMEKDKKVQEFEQTGDVLLLNSDLRKAIQELSARFINNN